MIDASYRLSRNANRALPNRGSASIISLAWQGLFLLLCMIAGAVAAISVIASLVR